MESYNEKYAKVVPKIKPPKDGPDPKQLKQKLKKSYRPLMGAILLVVVAFGCLKAYQFMRPALSIGQTRVTKATYDRLVELSKKSQVDTFRQEGKNPDAKTTIIEAEKYKLAAAKFGLSVSDDAIKGAAKVKYGLQNTDNLDDWQRLSSYKEAFEQAESIARTATYKASVYYFGFGRYVDTNLLEPTDPNFGKAEKIAEDRKYAEAKAREYRQKLLSKTITPLKAREEILLDNRLDFGSFGNNTRELIISSTGFTAALQGIGTGTKLGGNELNTIKALAPGGVSEPKIVNVRLVRGPDGKGGRGDIGFFIAQLEQKLVPRPELEKQIPSYIKSLKVVDNVK